MLLHLSYWAWHACWLNEAGWLVCMYMVLWTCSKTTWSAMQNYSICVAKPFDLLGKPFNPCYQTIRFTLQTIWSTLKNYSICVAKQFDLLGKPFDPCYQTIRFTLQTIRSTLQTIQSVLLNHWGAFQTNQLTLPNYWIHIARWFKLRFQTIWCALHNHLILLQNHSNCIAKLFKAAYVDSFPHNCPGLQVV